MGQYKKHVFVCTEGKTCGKEGGPDVHAIMKKLVKQSSVSGDVRINKSGCMNQCGHGPMVVVYPEDVWYAGVDEKGARRIVEEHVIGGVPVKKYRYIAPPGDNKLED